MSFEDRTLVCRDCNSEFTFTTGEQEFYKEKGFTNDPTRCQNCRSQRKSSGGGFGGGSREMHTATCSACGKDAKVPFVPRGDKPVYCSDCFQSQKPASSAGRGGSSRW